MRSSLVSSIVVIASVHTVRLRGLMQDIGAKCYYRVSAAFTIHIAYFDNLLPVTETSI